MKKKDKDIRDREKWTRMNILGKRAYLLKQGIIQQGLIRGLCFGVFFHVSLSGLNFFDFNFIRRIVIGAIVFAIVGYVEALFTWGKYKRKFSIN